MNATDKLFCSLDMTCCCVVSLKTSILKPLHHAFQHERLFSKIDNSAALF